MNFSGYEPVETLSPVIPNGRYAAKIKDVFEKQLQSGSVLNVVMTIKDHADSQPDTYSIFECPVDEKKRRVWNWQLTKFFDSFGITRGDWNYKQWVNKYGTVDVTQDYNKKAGKSYATLHPVKKDDPQTADYMPKDAAQGAPDRKFVASEFKQNGWPAAQQPDDFPEDIPF